MHHPCVDKIIGLLGEHQIPFESFEHAPVRTSEEAAKLRPEFTLNQGAKAIIVRVKIPDVGKKFVMFVVPGDMRFDNEKVKQNLHMKDIRFATEEEISELTDGVLPGGVPPFGNLFDLPVYADQRLFNNEKIIFNAGDRSYSIAMAAEDYKKVVNPTVVNIV